jgi:hypothetical protein
MPKLLERRTEHAVEPPEPLTIKKPVCFPSPIHQPAQEPASPTTPTSLFGLVQSYLPGSSAASGGLPHDPNETVGFSDNTNEQGQRKSYPQQIFRQTMDSLWGSSGNNDGKGREQPASFDRDLGPKALEETDQVDNKAMMLPSSAPTPKGVFMHQHASSREQHIKNLNRTQPPRRKHSHSNRHSHSHGQHRKKSAPHNSMVSRAADAGGADFIPRGRNRAASEPRTRNRSMSDTGRYVYQDGSGYPPPPPLRCKTDFNEVNVIGRGTYGEVLLVQNKLDGRKYALKNIGYVPHSNYTQTTPPPPPHTHTHTHPPTHTYPHPITPAHTRPTTPTQQPTTPTQQPTKPEKHKQARN